MLFGYARCSLASGNEARQIEELTKYGVELNNIYVDKESGAKSSRPKLNELKKILRPGDVLAIHDLSRLARSVTLTFELVNWLKDNEITLISIKEGIDTSKPISTLLLAVLAAVAEMEREQINERCQQGREIAKREGRMGRPKANPEKVEKALRLFESNNYSVSEIANMTGVSPATIYRKAKEQGITRK